MDHNHRTARLIWYNPDYFVLKASGRALRSYQREVLNAIIRSIRAKSGHSFVVVLARQSGKNELQAHLFTSGTTGVDTHLTVSAHTDGKIYIENRGGAATTFCYLLLGG